MIKYSYSLFFLFVVFISNGIKAKGQLNTIPDSNRVIDEMVQKYLDCETEKIHSRFLENVNSLEEWKRLCPNYKQEYFYMLGLWPVPPKTPLKVTITGTLEGDGYYVDMLHYQSRPRLYVTANLYRPKDFGNSQRLPAVLYVCGHTQMGRDGNKTAFQSHGIWFARHGYICLILDTLQLGEIAGVHHGTYSEDRWWWHSRGYTPAGVECLNGIRGIDYLVGREDVDPNRIAVTGISGGGAATFWIAAADERVRVAVAVSGMGDLMSYVPEQVINRHCDCMFFYNIYQWPWSRIGGMVAPRPLLFENSDNDPYFPMSGNQRVINRLGQVYKLYGEGDLVDSFVSTGEHGYRQDIRKAVYRFINLHLKNDEKIVEDSEVDLIKGSEDNRLYPIEPGKLRVFAQDSDIPKDELNSAIDQYFVPMAKIESPRKGGYETWKTEIMTKLRNVTFRYFPERIPVGKLIKQVDSNNMKLMSEPGVEISLQFVAKLNPAKEAKRILMVVKSSDFGKGVSDWINCVSKYDDHIYLCVPREVGKLCKADRNYIKRSYVLLGRTVETGQVWDVASAARYLKAKYNDSADVYVLGEGGDGILAAYAALLEPDIAGVIINEPPLSHMDVKAPQFLNILRVCDIPDTLGMLAPRPLSVCSSNRKLTDKIAEIYKAAGTSAKFVKKLDLEIP